MAKTHLTVGEVARRSGLPVSTLHVYERLGLIASERTAANHRLFRREVLRRVSVIKVARSVGLPLAEIAAAPSGLPKDRAPDIEDRERLAAWHEDLTRRITLLTALARQDGDVHRLRMPQREALPARERGRPPSQGRAERAATPGWLRSRARAGRSVRPS